MPAEKSSLENPVPLPSGSFRPLSIMNDNETVYPDYAEFRKSVLRPLGSFMPLSIMNDNGTVYPDYAELRKLCSSSPGEHQTVIHK